MTADIHFSPLALTHALPFLPLAQGDIDYQVDRRSEPGLIDELLAEPTTKVVLTRGGLVAVPRGQGELVDYENVKMRLATLPGAYVSAELARYPEAVAMFLGSYVGARGESVVAVDITRVPEAGVPGVGGIAGVGGAVGGVLGTQDSGTVDGALGKNGISGGAAAGIRQPGNAKGNGGVAAAKIAGPLGVPDSAGQGADDAFDDSVGLGPEAHAAATGRDPVRLGGPARICPSLQRARGRASHQCHHLKHLAQPPAVLSHLWRGGPAGARRMGAAMHQRGGRQPCAVPTRGAGGHYRHRGRARPSAAATQRGMEGFEAVFGVRRICGGGGEP